MTNKQWRQSIYQWLASEGFTWNKLRHKELRRLLNAREEDDEFLESDELETDDQL